MRSPAVSLVPAVVLWTVASCTAGASPRRTAAETAADQVAPAERETALTIPITDVEGTAAALDRLATGARAGQLDAAWSRIHYLLDLFDDARFARDDTSLVALHRGLGLTGRAARGRAATDAVLAALLRDVDRLLARERSHVHGRAAFTVLRFDAHPPATRSQVRGRMAELKAIAGQGGPLAANARLRLIGYCTRALADAVVPTGPAGDSPSRIHRMMHCLYPLTDVDPEHHLAERRSSASDRRSGRAPPPGWRELTRDLAGLIDLVASGDTRLGRAGRYQRRTLADFLAKHRHRLRSLE